jgi:putative Flp pilus-assembly TadE/G-like protein
MRSVRRGLGNERGSVVVVVAVSLFAMLAMAALAIDLASLRDSKAESQRAADAVALAGASAFRDLPWTDAATVNIARTRAKEIARWNKVRNDTLYVQTIAWQKTPNAGLGVWTDSMRDVTINFIPDSQKVRVWVRRAGIRTFFSKMLGRPFGHVQSMATAWATNAGPTVNCMKPFVMPDMWHEGDKATQDVNNNDYWDPNTTGPGNGQDGESWKYQPASVGGSDYYAPFDPSVTNPPLPQTGYGSAARSGIGYPGDVGLPMLIKPQTGNGNGKPAPERMGNAFWLLDLDPVAGTEDEIKFGCNKVKIGDPVPYESGGKTGPVKKGVTYLVNEDPGATWNQSTKQVEGSSYADWTRSPRVITIGLIDPKYWIATSKNDKPDPGSTYSNFARMFILSADGNDNIQAIFLGTAAGSAGGPTGGTLVKVLQLIQ